MKKKIIAIILGAITAISMTACKKNNDDALTEESFTNIVNSFENINDYYKINVQNGWDGLIDINKNADYVTHGNASLYMEVGGKTGAGASAPALLLNLSENGENVDLSKLRSVTLDMFNETDKEQTVKLSIGIGKTVSESTAVKVPVGKNKVTYTPNVKGLSFGNDLKEGKTLRMEFSVPQEGEPRRKFYIDALTVNENFVEHTPIVADLDENEFCSFEKDFQQYVNKPWAVGPAEDCLPTMSINKDPKYCHGDGKKSLRAYCPAQAVPLFNAVPQITFISGLMKQFDWRELVEKKASLNFWIYNPYDAPMKFGFNFWNSESHAEAFFPLNDIGNFGAGEATVKKGWTEISLPLENMDRDYVNDENHVRYKHSFLDNVNAFAIGYNAFGGEAREYYFDDFRFVFPQEPDQE